MGRPSGSDRRGFAIRRLTVCLLVALPLHADVVTGPDGKIYEKILAPLVGRADGAFSTLWSADVIAFNGGSEVARVTGAPEVLDYVYDPRIPTCAIEPVQQCLGLVRPNGTAVVNFPRLEGLRTAFVYVERNGAKQVFLSSEAYTVEASARSTGTGLPLVQEEETGSRVAIAFMRVFAGRRYTLRIYGYDSIEWPVKVTAIRFGEVQSVRQVQLQSVPDPYMGAFPGPTWAQVSLDQITEVPPLGADGRFDVTLVFEAPPGAKIWAMASATDNTTQESAVYSSEIADLCDSP